VDAVGVISSDGAESLRLDDFEVGWLGPGGECRAALRDVAGEVFEDVPPVRSFPVYRGQRHFPGLYWSATTGRHVGFESWLERDHAILLDFDATVTGFASQPLWLSWRQAGRQRRHAPDFFARAVNGSGVVIDCRPVERRDELSVVAFAAAERACGLLGWVYRLVGEIDRVRVGNLRWLAGYRHPRNGEPAALAAAVVSAFSVPSPLVAQAATVGDPIMVLPVVFHLLWRGRLTTDLSLPLSDHTLVGRDGGGR
jgi:hypothetical protein